MDAFSLEIMKTGTGVVLYLVDGTRIRAEGAKLGDEHDVTLAEFVDGDWLARTFKLSEIDRVTAYRDPY